MADLGLEVVMQVVAKEEAGKILSLSLSEYSIRERERKGCVCECVCVCVCVCVLCLYAKNRERERERERERGERNALVSALILHTFHRGGTGGNAWGRMNGREERSTGIGTHRSEALVRARTTEALRSGKVLVTTTVMLTSNLKDHWRREKVG